MPIFQKSKDDSIDIARYVKDQYLQGVTALHDLRVSSQRMYDIVRGDIIKSDERSKLESRGLPAVDLNIVLPKIQRIMGAERRARVGIKAIPLRKGKNETAKVYTQLLEKIRVDSDGLRQIRDAWMDSIICNLPGWLEVIWTNDNDPLGQPIYRALNPFYVIWDPKSTIYDLSDARWVMKTWWATKDDLLRDFPDKVTEIKSNFNYLKRVTGMVQTSWERLRGVKISLDEEFDNQKENLVRVIEAQLREEVRETRLFDPETQSVERVQDREELIVMKSRYPRLIEVDFKWDKIRVATVVSGKILLQNVDADVQNGMFSLIPIWAHTFGNKPFGLVKNLEGPQQIFWKETNSALHIENMLANPIWMIPKGSMDEEEIKDLERYGSRYGYILEYDTIAGQRPQRDMVNVQVIGKLTLAERAFNLANQISGIGPNATGLADTTNESGELVKTRIAETLTMLEGLFDNKMKSTVLLHYYLIALIQTKMGAMRILRYIDEGNTSQTLIVNQRTVFGIKNNLKQGEYGIAIEKGEAQYYRQEKFVKLIMLSRVLGVNTELIDLIIDTFDEITDSEKEALKQSVKKQQLEPDLAKMETELRQHSLQRGAQDVKKTQAEVKKLAEISRLNQRG